MAKDERNKEVGKSIMYTMELLYSRKPNDGSPIDNIYAITLTDIQKAYAYFVYSIGSYEEWLKSLEDAEKEKAKNKRKD